MRYPVASVRLPVASVRFSRRVSPLKFLHTLIKKPASALMIDRKGRKVVWISRR